MTDIGLIQVLEILDLFAQRLVFAFELGDFMA